MRLWFTLFVIVCCVRIGNAQPNWEWTDQIRAFGSSYSNARGIELTEDDSGNIVSGGFFQDSADLNPGAGTMFATNQQMNSGQHGYVLKVDQSGNYRWAVDINCAYSMVYGIVTDDSCNVYVGGVFTGLCDFDPGVGTFQLFGTTDIFILKLSPNGNFMWAQQVGGPASEEMSAMTIDDDNNVIATARFCNSIDLDPGTGTYWLSGATTCRDFFILKLNSNGQFVSGGQIATTTLSQLYVDDIETDDFRNVYLVGSFEGPGTTDFDPGAGQANIFPLGDADGFILKLDSNCNFIWVKQMGYLDWDLYRDIEIDASNNLILSGEFSMFVDLDPGSGVSTYTSSGSSDPFFCKLDSAGNLIWVAHIAGGTYGWTIGSDISVDDGTGNLFYAGGLEYGADLDPGPGVLTFPSGLTYDMFLCCYNSNGQLLWGDITSATGHFGVFSLYARNKEFTITGHFQDDANFAVAPAAANYSATVFQDGYISHYSESNIDAVDEYTNSPFTIFPNPSFGTVWIYSQTKLKSLSILDVNGREVESNPACDEESSFQIHQPPGIYFVKGITVDGRSIVQRIVVQ